MADAKNPETIADIYNNLSSSLLSSIVGQTTALLQGLNADLSDDKKSRLNKAFEEYVKERCEDKKDELYKHEAYVHPELSSLPSLLRGVQALDNFLKVSQSKENKLTALGEAAGSLRYELFDQFAQSLNGLNAVLKETQVAPATCSILTENISGQCNAVYTAIQGRRDSLFLAEVQRLKEKDTQPAIVQKEGIEGQIAIPLQEVKTAADALRPLLKNLPRAEQDKIAKLTLEYAKQCSLSAEPVLNEKILPNLETLLERTHQTLSNQLDELKNAGVFKTLESPETGKLNTQEEEQMQIAVNSVWNTANNCRVLVRALTHMLNATNKEQGKDFSPDLESLSKPGDYDNLIKLGATLTGNFWRIQSVLGTALDEHQKREKTAAASQQVEKQSPVTPPTNLNQAGGNSLNTQEKGANPSPTPLM